MLVSLLIMDVTTSLIKVYQDYSDVFGMQLLDDVLGMGKLALVPLEVIKAS